MPATLTIETPDSCAVCPLEYNSEYMAQHTHTCSAVDSYTDVGLKHFGRTLSRAYFCPLVITPEVERLTAALEDAQETSLLWKDRAKLTEKDRDRYKARAEALERVIQNQNVCVLCTNSKINRLKEPCRTCENYDLFVFDEARFSAEELAAEYD